MIKYLIIILLLLSGCADEKITPMSPVVVVGYTGSMEPIFHGGELRTVIHTPYNQLKEGQIALTWWGGNWHPHRLKSKFMGRWTTQGDASPYPDPFKMTEVNYGGTIEP